MSRLERWVSNYHVIPSRPLCWRSFTRLGRRGLAISALEQVLEQVRNGASALSRCAERRGDPDETFAAFAERAMRLRRIRLVCSIHSQRCWPGMHTRSGLGKSSIVPSKRNSWPQLRLRRAEVNAILGNRDDAIAEAQAIAAGKADETVKRRAQAVHEAEADARKVVVERLHAVLKRRYNLHYPCPMAYSTGLRL